MNVDQISRIILNHFSIKDGSSDGSIAAFYENCDNAAQQILDEALSQMGVGTGQAVASSQPISVTVGGSSVEEVLSGLQSEIDRLKGRAPHDIVSNPG